MHESSMKNMKAFRDNYLSPGLKVLDVGSQDINGSYKKLFEKYDYVGFDVVNGENVDVSHWDKLEDNFFDAVISGQAFEHIKDDLAVMKEIERVLKPRSYCCIIAPSIGRKHCLPDYRRYQPEDFRVLAEKAGLIVFSTWIDPTGKWRDCVLIAGKLRETMAQ